MISLTQLADVNILVGSDFFWSIVNKWKNCPSIRFVSLVLQIGYLLTCKFLDPHGEVKRDNQQLSAYFVMTHMIQRVSEVNLFSTGDTFFN